MQPRYRRDKATRPPPPCRAQVVEQYKGRQLCLGNGATGYKGVFKTRLGKFEAQRNAESRNYSLGSNFETAIDAAVAYHDSLKRVGAYRSLA